MWWKVALWNEMNLLTSWFTSHILMRKYIEGFCIENSQPTYEHTYVFCWKLNNKFEICIIFQIWSSFTHWVFFFNSWMLVTSLEYIVNTMFHCHWHALSSNFIVIVKLGWMLNVHQWLYTFWSVFIVNHSKSSRSQNNMS